MAKIRVQRVDSSTPSISKRELYARVCYYYPQYNLQQARNLPARDLQLLLQVANKIEAQHYFNMTQIVASPHTKKGSGVKKLADKFKQLAKATIK